MNVNFNQRALELAVTEFRVLMELGDPVTPAAFGIAVAHLQSRLNLSLLVAAEMLRLELDRQAALKLASTTDLLRGSDMDDETGQRMRAETLRALKEPKDK